MYKYLAQFGKMKNGVGIDAFVNNMNEILDIILESSEYQGVISVLIPIGLLLCVVYFCIDIMDRVANINFNFETLLRRLIRFIFVFMVVSNLPALLSGTNEFVKLLNGEITSSFSASNDFAAFIEGNNDLITAQAAINQNSTDGVLTGLNSFIALIFNVSLQLITIMLGVERAIMIGVKGALAPLIVPDMFNNGINSSGMKFLKGLFANYLQTTVVIFLTEMACIVAFDNGTSVTGHSSIVFMGMDTIVAGVIVTCVLVGTLKRSSEYAQQMMEGRL